MSKEHIHAVMDSPRFDPYTTEDWFTPKGILVSRDLYRTQINLKRGSSSSFIDNFRQIAAKNEAFKLKFYSPAGSEMTAEIRRLSLHVEQTNPLYDTITLLVCLSPDQILAVIPSDDGPEFGY